MAADSGRLLEPPFGPALQRQGVWRRLGGQPAPREDAHGASVRPADGQSRGPLDPDDGALGGFEEEARRGCHSGVERLTPEVWIKRGSPTGGKYRGASEGRREDDSNVDITKSATIWPVAGSGVRLHTLACSWNN